MDVGQRAGHEQDQRRRCRTGDRLTHAAATCRQAMTTVRAGGAGCGGPRVRIEVVPPRWPAFATRVEHRDGAPGRGHRRARFFGGGCADRSSSPSSSRITLLSVTVRRFELAIHAAQTEPLLLHSTVAPNRPSTASSAQRVPERQPRAQRQRPHDALRCGGSW